VESDGIGREGTREAIWKDVEEMKDKERRGGR